MEIDMKLRYCRATFWAFMLCLLLIPIGIEVASAQEGAAVAGGITDSAGIALSAAITMAGSAFAAGWAISATGVAATGATAEKPEVFGRVLIFVALAEAIAIYGLLIAFMLWTKI